MANQIIVELHLHGSRAVVRGVFEALEGLNSSEGARLLLAGRSTLDEAISRPLIRPADRGEFTRYILYLPFPSLPAPSHHSSDAPSSLVAWIFWRSREWPTS